MGLRKRAMKYCSLQKTYAKNSDFGKIVGEGAGSVVLNTIPRASIRYQIIELN